MKILEWLVLFLVFRENAASVRRVVNGRVAATAQFNGVAALMLANGKYVFPICGGAVVANNIILTAAHCVKYCRPKKTNFKKYYVHAGSNHLKKGQLRMIENVTCAGDLNDIALIKLTEPFKPEVTKVAFPTKLERLIQCQAVGWGSTQEETARFTHKVSCVKNCKLMYTKVKLVDITLCRSLLKQIDKESDVKLDGSEFCTLGNNTDTCRGDSGGPLFCGENMQLQGLVSWGIGCAQPQVPSVNVFVPFFAKWYQNVLDEWKL